MIHTRSKRGHASTRSRALGVAVSLVANAAFLAVLALSARVQGAYGPSRAIELRLVSPTPPKAQPGHEQGTALRAKNTPPAVPPRPAMIAAPPAAPQASAPSPAPPTDHGVSGVGAALRASLGCDHASFLGLTTAEKQRCQQRMVARSGGAPATDIGINPEARTEFDMAWNDEHTPQHLAYLGCKARFGMGQFAWQHAYHRPKLGPLPCYLTTPEAIVLPDKPKPTGG